MDNVKVNRDDICTPGVEDLRSQSEILVAIPVAPDMTADVVAEEARTQINMTSQSELVNPDDVFDAVIEYYEGTAIDVNCVDAHNQATTECEDYGVDPDDVDSWPTLFIYLELMEA